MRTASTLALAMAAMVFTVACASRTCSSHTGASGKAAPQTAPQTATVKVTESGYEPSAITLKGGVPAKITFKRTTDKTCGTEIVLPALKVSKPLPLNKPVVVSFTPKKGQTVAFTCGMNMLKGKVVAK